MPAVPRMSEVRAAEVARELYGVTAVAARLASEHDDTFRLALPDGSLRFLRASAPDVAMAGTGQAGTTGHAGAGAAGASFLTAILLHLARSAPGLPVQRVIPSLSGAAEVMVEDVAGAGARLVRMTTFLPGRLLREVPSSAGLRRDVGATLARLSLALRDFTHPAARRTHHWDLQNASQLRPLLAELPGLAPGLRGRLAGALDRFEAVVRPALAGVPVQVIHTDFHGDNLLASDDGSAVRGVLDFGDSLIGPVAQDVAVAACYQLGADRDGGTDPLASALDVIAGYHAADPLRPADLPLIADFIVLRLATRVIVSQWNAAREPANSAYLLRRTPQAITQFDALRAIPREAVIGRLRTAAGMNDASSE
ncbi:MAG: aminoglycoside phosphotransferase [Actinomycetia bacterium]|nr:aminoglycoside phosphotransferase [Actinomycetes bacterium]